MNLLLKTLDENLIPRVEVDNYRLITEASKPVPGDRMSIEVTPAPIKGKRVAEQGRRPYRNLRLKTAEWPEQGLDEVRAPKMMAVLNGQVDLQVRDKLFHCHEGHLVVIPSGAPHSAGEINLSAGAGTSYDLLWFLLFDRSVQCWISRRRDGKDLWTEQDNWLVLNDQVAQLFRIAIEEAIARRETWEKACSQLLGAFFTLMRRELALGHFTHPGPMVTTVEPVSPEGWDPIGQAQEYIRTHLHATLSIDKVAQAVHLSRTQFSRRIRRETGKTFVEFVTECRIREAKTLLRDSEWTITLIAEFIGLKSSTYFHGLFLRYVGISPGQYRQESRMQKRAD